MHDVTGDGRGVEDVGLDACAQPGRVGRPTAPRPRRRIRRRAPCGRRTAACTRRPAGRRGDHADVVEIGHQHGAALHEPAALDRARRQQPAVELLGEPGRPTGHVAHVDDAVIGERGRVCAGIGEERLVGRGTTQRASPARSAASSAPRGGSGRPDRGNGPARRRRPPSMPVVPSRPRRSSIDRATIDRAPDAAERYSVGGAGRRG